MPELPEVETVRRGLEKHLVGHRVVAVKVLRDKSFPNDQVITQKYLLGAEIIGVSRRAKLLLIELDNDYTLAVHLRMTGQLVFRADNGVKFGAGHPTDSLVDELPDKSTRVILELDGAQLFFNDQRVFGWMQLLPTVEVEQMKFVRTLGPEPLSQAFTDKVFIVRMLKRKNSRVKTALLDQKVLAGLGNIYVDEALWLAKIHPETKVVKITDVQLKRLRKAVVSVLELGIEKGGSTDKNYVDAEGKKGSYLAFAKVFRREGAQCERCGGEIMKIRVAGRGTHICVNCQVPPKET